MTLRKLVYGQDPKLKESGVRESVNRSKLHLPLNSGYSIAIAQKYWLY